MSLQVIPSHPSIPPRLPSVIFFAWTIQEPQTPPLAATITFLLCYGPCLFSVLRISPHSSAWHKGFLKSICLSHFLSFFQSRSLSHKFNQVLQCTALCVLRPLPGKLFLLLSPPHPGQSLPNIPGPQAHTHSPIPGIASRPAWFLSSKPIE